ncbi:hypothetical protein HS125_11210 [bacterium]|nr:hypothetical protein [bacterium]
MPDIFHPRPLNPDDYRHLAENPLISDRKRIIDIIAAAIFLVQALLALLAAVGLFSPASAQDRPPLWWILAIVVVLDAPVFVLVASRLASEAAGKGARHAAAAAVPMIVLPLAWCIVTGVLGLISPLLGATPPIVASFMAVGLLAHWPLYFAYRGKAVDLMLVELAREEDARRRP